MAKLVNSEEILESTAKLMLSVFSEDYDNRFEEMLVSGGGGNSMFVNAWQKPSKEFIRVRISSQAKKIFQQLCRFILFLQQTDCFLSKE